MSAPSTLTSTSRLRIGRIRALGLTPDADPAAQQRLREALLIGISRDLTHALRTTLVPALAETNDGVWIVRQLDIDVEVQASRDRQILARAMGQGTSQRLARVLRRNHEPENVRWFADRSDLLAAFLMELARGGGKQWYFASLHPLLMLPTSAAIRTAVCDRPATGGDALRRLSVNAQDQLLTALNVQDARRILDFLSETDVCGDRAESFDGAVMASLENAPRFCAADAIDGLRLYLASFRSPQRSGTALRDAALALVCLRRQVQQRSAHALAEVIASISDGDIARLIVQAGSSDAGALIPLGAMPPAWLRDAASAMQSANRRTSPATIPHAELRYTRFGGAFLLLPHLARMPLREATDGWPACGDLHAADAVRFLLLIKCLGSPNSASAFDDALLRELMQVPPDIEQAIFERWSRTISSVARRRFLKVVKEWHRQQTYAPIPRAHILVSIDDNQRRRAILIDVDHGVWQAVVPFRGPLRRSLIESLLEQYPSDVLAVDPDLLETARAAHLDVRIIDVTDASAVTASGPLLAAAVERLGFVCDDLAYLSASAISLPNPFDRALGVAAQGLLRTFARRLPGISRAHLSYLWANCLSGSASLLEQDDRRIVYLSRPPLALLLGIAGVDRERYILPGLDELPFVLYSLEA